MTRQRRYDTSFFQPLEFLESRTMLSTSPITIHPNKPQNQAQLQTRAPKILSELGANPVHQIAGQTGPETLLAAFKSDLAASKASVTIDWGDGTPTTVGTVRALNKPWHSGQVTQYGIYGSHTYQNAGDYVVTVTVTMQGALGYVTASTTGAASVSAPPAPPTVVLPVIPTIPTYPPVDFTTKTFDDGITRVTGAIRDLPSVPILNGAGVQTSGGNFISYSNPAWSFSATIDWGDGSGPVAVTAWYTGQGVQIPAGALPPGWTPALIVDGLHTYQASGKYTLTVVVTTKLSLTGIPASKSFTLDITVP